MTRITNSIAMAGLALGLVASAPASAVVIYSTGFEQPGFLPGLISGQGGWAVFGTSAAATVQSGIAASGTQAVEVNGSLVAGQTGPWRSSPTAYPLVSLSADLMFTSSSAMRGWQFAGLGAGLIGFAGGVDFDPNGNIRAISAGYAVIGTYVRDSFFNVDIRLDYSAQTYSVLIDHNLIASGIPFCGDNGACAGGPVPAFSTLIFDTFGTGGNDLGYMDNISVQTYSVPEPSIWAMMIGGLAVAGGLLRSRRRTPPLLA